MTKDEALKLALEALRKAMQGNLVFDEAMETFKGIEAALEAKDEPVCKDCNGTGSADSGGTHPWGESIFIRCHCTYFTQPQQ